MISALLEELKDIQGTGLHWNWSWIGPGFKDEDVLLFPRIFFVKGDSLGHDKFCCLRGGSGNPQCRYCDCPFDEMDSADFSLKATNMADLAKWTGHAGSHSKNLDKATKLGHHAFSENAFFPLCFCHKHGLNASCPAEILHQCQHGVAKHALLGFFNLTCTAGRRPTMVFSDAVVELAESALSSTGYQLSGQSDRSLPKTFFWSGYVPCKSKEKKTTQRGCLKCCGQEMCGTLLVVLTMLLTEHPGFVEKPRVGVSLKKRIGDARVGLHIQLFDTLIVMEAWLKQEAILKKDLKKFRKFIPKFMEHCKSVINRTVGEGLKI
jgi:hypothetical protein